MIMEGEEGLTLFRLFKNLPRRVSTFSLANHPSAATRRHFKAWKTVKKNQVAQEMKVCRIRSSAKVGDLVWVMAFPSTWWPGRIKRFNGRFVSVSFFGCNKTHLFKPSEILRFEEAYPRLVKMLGIKLSYEIGLAMDELSRSTAIGLKCSCSVSSVDEDKSIAVKRAFNPREILDFVIGKATLPQVGSGEIATAVRVSAALNSFRYDSVVCKTSEVDEGFCAEGVLDFVRDMAVKPCVDEKAVEQLLSFRRFTSVKPNWFYQQDWELDEDSFESLELEDMMGEDGLESSRIVDCSYDDQFYHDAKTWVPEVDVLVKPLVDNKGGDTCPDNLEDSTFFDKVDTDAQRSQNFFFPNDAKDTAVDVIHMPVNSNVQEICVINSIDLSIFDMDDRYDSPLCDADDDLFAGIHSSCCTEVADAKAQSHRKSSLENDSNEPENASLVTSLPQNDPSSAFSSSRSKVSTNLRHTALNESSAVPASSYSSFCIEVVDAEATSHRESSLGNDLNEAENANFVISLPQNDSSAFRSSRSKVLTHLEHTALNERSAIPVANYSSCCTEMAGVEAQSHRKSPLANDSTKAENANLVISLVQNGPNFAFSSRSIVPTNLEHTSQNTSSAIPAGSHSSLYTEVADSESQCHRKSSLANDSNGAENADLIISWRPNDSNSVLGIVPTNLEHTAQNECSAIPVISEIQPLRAVPLSGGRLYSLPINKCTIFSPIKAINVASKPLPGPEIPEMTPFAVTTPPISSNKRKHYELATFRTYKSHPTPVLAAKEKNSHGASQWKAYYSSPLTDVEPHPAKSSPVLLNMKFPKDYPLPSKEELEKKFGAFGPLDRTRTKVFFYTGVGQVVFLHSADAVTVSSLVTKKRVFGQANVRFWFYNIPPFAVDTMKPLTSPTLIHMKFPKDCSLPSKEELEKKFGVFGPLNCSRTAVFLDVRCGRVVFLHSADAAVAYDYAAKGRMFGQAGVRFWFSKNDVSINKSNKSWHNPKSCLKKSWLTRQTDKRENCSVRFSL